MGTAKLFVRILWNHDIRPVLLNFCEEKYIAIELKAVTGKVMLSKPVLSSRPALATLEYPRGFFTYSAAPKRI